MITSTVDWLKPMSWSRLLSSFPYNRIGVIYLYFRRSLARRVLDCSTRSFGWVTRSMLVWRLVQNLELDRRVDLVESLRKLLAQFVRPGISEWDGIKPESELTESLRKECIVRVVKVVNLLKLAGWRGKLRWARMVARSQHRRPSHSADPFPRTARDFRIA